MCIVSLSQFWLRGRIAKTTKGIFHTTDHHDPCISCGGGRGKLAGDCWLLPVDGLGQQVVSTGTVHHMFLLGFIPLSLSLFPF